MIRKLCFVLIGLLTFCSSSHANLIVDNFAFGAQIGVASNNVDRGGSFLSDLRLNQSIGGVNPVYNAATDSYSSAGVAVGESFSVTYDDFGGADAVNGLGQTLGTASGMGPFVSLIVPVSVSMAELGDWNLLVGGTVGGIYYDMPIVVSGNQTIISVAGLENDQTLTLRFTYNGTNATGTSLVYGGSGNTLNAPVVPEPTTLMMFGTVVGLGLAHRRRRK